MSTPPGDLPPESGTTSGTTGAQPTSSTPTEEVATTRSSRLPWLIGGAIVVLLIALVAVPAFVLNDDGTPDRPEGGSEDILDAAKVALDEAENVYITIDASSVPDSVGTALLSAEGTAVRPDGFSGVLTVRFSGGEIDADVVAIDGATYADLPFVGWSDVDPEDYSAPDPGLLLDPDAGISTLITATSGLEADGEQVESCENGDNANGYPYVGELDGDAVRSFIPSADGDTFDVRYVIGDEDRPCRIDVTGVFYDGEDPLTYSVGLSAYDDPDPVEITRP